MGKLPLGMQPLFWIGCVTGSLALSSVASAHHPNEGDVTLSTLLTEASESNLEIKESEKTLAEVSSLRRQTISGFLPHLSLDGGSQTTRYDNQKSSGLFGHITGALNLYHGGRDENMRGIWSIEEEHQIAKSEKTKARIDREVSKKYYELLFLLEAVALKNEALEANRIQKKLAEKKKAAGFTSGADVLEFELRESTLQSDITFLKLETVTKERELALLIGRPQGTPIHVQGHLERIRVAKTSDELLNRALNEREDLKEAETNLKISELGYNSLFGDYLPRVDLEATYGKLANDERVFDGLNNYSFALKISVPIFSGLETTYARQAKVQEIAKNDLSATRIRQEIKVQLENALSKLQSIEERLDIEEKNVTRSKQYYDITLSEYRKGVKNSPDVASAAERLFDAYLRNLEYRRNYQLGQIELAEAMGVASGDL